MDWILNNKEWIFSGLGVAILTALVYTIAGLLRFMKGAKSSSARIERGGGQSITIDISGNESDDEVAQKVASAIKVKGIPYGAIKRSSLRYPESAALECKGEVNGIPSGHHLWLCVRHRGLIWPKEPEITADAAGHWSARLHGQGEAKELVLIAIDENAHQKIMAWIDRGKKTGDYPGMTLSEEMKELDAIRLKMGL